jgi:hypothetical protein
MVPADGCALLARKSLIGASSCTLIPVRTADYDILLCKTSVGGQINPDHEKTEHKARLFRGTRGRIRTADPLFRRQML